MIRTPGHACGRRTGTRLQIKYQTLTHDTVTYLHISNEVCGICPTHGLPPASLFFPYAQPHALCRYRVRGATTSAGASSVAPRGIVPQPGRRPMIASKVAFRRHHARGGRNQNASTNPQAVRRRRSSAR